jgi:hypothetical protein
MWLILFALAGGILFHKPLIGIIVALLLAASALSHYLFRRKQRSDV